MIGKLKKLISHKMAKSMIIYLISNVLAAGIPFLLLPYLTNALTPADYGLISMFQVLFSFFAPFIGYSSLSAISKRFFFLKKEEFVSYTSTVFWIIILSTLPISILVMVFGDFIAEISSFPRIWLWSVIVYALAHQVVFLVLTLYRLWDNATSFAIVRVSRVVLEIGFTFLFISLMSKGWSGRVEAQYLAASVFAVVSILILVKKKHLRLEFNQSAAKNALKYGLPLIPHSLGAVIITFTDRLFINNFQDVSAVGIYTVGYQVGMIIMVVQNSFNQAWTPWLFGELKENEESKNKRVVRFTYLYFFVLLALAALLYICTPLIFRLFIGSAFQGAMEIVLFIALGFAINGMYKSVVSFLFYTEHTMLIGLITLLTAIVNLGLNYFWVEEFGIKGAAVATLVAFSMQFILIWGASAYYYRMPWLKFR